MQIILPESGGPLEKAPGPLAFLSENLVIPSSETQKKNYLVSLWQSELKNNQNTEDANGVQVDLFLNALT